MTGIPRFESYEDELRTDYGDPNRDIFTVSGMTGVGTTTISRLLCETFNMDRVNAGDFFRKKARERDMGIQEFDDKQPEIEEREDTDFDLEWDRTALRYAFTKNHFLLEGRLSGVLLTDIAPIRIYVSCDTETVASRITQREELDAETAEEHVQTRNQEVLERYQDKYGVDPRDEQYYNVFIDNSQPLSQVKEALMKQVRSKLPDHYP